MAPLMNATGSNPHDASPVVAAAMLRPGLYAERRPGEPLTSFQARAVLAAEQVLASGSVIEIG